jgi:hypothetical protein
MESKLDKYARGFEDVKNELTVTLTNKLEYFLMLQHHLFPDEP